MKTCKHCALPLAQNTSSEFCCNGCASAYAIIQNLNLTTYYDRRTLDPDKRFLIPELQHMALLDTFERTEEDITHLHFMVDGLHCAACVWLIEHALKKEAGVHIARLNMTTHRLHIAWDANITTAEHLIHAVNSLGYRLMPYDPAEVNHQHKQQEKKLLLAMAVAGFAAANVMLLSVALWAGAENEGGSLALLLQWLSALIVLPAAAYAGRPFFESAFTALRAKHMNMDVPISIAILLTLGLSMGQLFFPPALQTAHTWFESAAMLIFFLLIGRYLDHRTRLRTQNAADHLMSLSGTSATLIENGAQRIVPSQSLKVGDVILVAAGEVCPADGMIIFGTSDLDVSLMTGESLPVAAHEGASVIAGSVNLTAPIQIRVSHVGENTRLSHIARLIDNATHTRNRYTQLADRLARYYAPVVHALAGATFIGWYASTGDIYQALVTATAVLIITCPCALALAVPAVQVASINRLLRQGILLTHSSALERLASAKSVVFDKTGTLTTGIFMLVHGQKEKHFPLAATLASYSKHPLAQALAAAYDGAALPLEDIQEVAGMGLEATHKGQKLLLGRASFCDVTAEEALKHPIEAGQSGVWLRYGKHLSCFMLADTLRPEAMKTVQFFEEHALPPYLFSGDIWPTVAKVADTLGIPDTHFEAGLTPSQKYERIESLTKEGQAPIMCGDGLNDAPALAAGHVGIAMASGADISKMTADIIIQKENLYAVAEAWQIARAAQRLVRVNFGLAFSYNIIAVPIAMVGLITPLWAAVFMSSSSLTVVLNALRLNNIKLR